MTEQELEERMRKRPKTQKAMKVSCQTVFDWEYKKTKH